NAIGVLRAELAQTRDTLGGIDDSRLLAATVAARNTTADPRRVYPYEHSGQVLEELVVGLATLLAKARTSNRFALETLTLYSGVGGEALTPEPGATAPARPSEPPQTGGDAIGLLRAELKRIRATLGGIDDPRLLFATVVARKATTDPQHANP